MDQKEALEESRKKNPGSRSLRCIWHCGKINEKIRQATRLGETRTEIVFPRGHYVTEHMDVFRKLYENQGYRVSFTPDYQYIRATQWTMLLEWGGDGNQ